MIEEKDMEKKSKVNTRREGNLKMARMANKSLQTQGKTLEERADDLQARARRFFQ